MSIAVVDAGTTSIRGMVYDAQGCVMDTVSVPTPVCVGADGVHVTQSPKVYDQALITILSALAGRHAIDAVSVTAYRSAPTLVDAQGNALCDFIMWQDTRNEAICRQIAREADDAVWQHSGARVNTVFTASKITWLKHNEPALYKKSYKALIVPDYLILKMTGCFATDYTYGSRTHVMNIRTLDWDGEMCRLFDLDQDKLADLRQQGSVIGTVTKEFAALSGLRAGIPVISAGGDQQCGALGLGVLDETVIEVNSGTGSFVIAHSDAPNLERKNAICNVSALPGKWMLEMNIISCASGVNWLIREFFPEYWDKPSCFDEINRIAESTPPGANRLCAVPHFQGCGSRAWNPQARACFYGFSLGSRKEDMVRALYEGIAIEIAKSIDALPDAVTQRAKSLAIAGGLSKSAIYRRILADVTGRTLTIPGNAQATAYGAFMTAAVTLGMFPSYQAAFSAGQTAERLTPDGSNYALYQALRERTEKLIRAMEC